MSEVTMDEISIQIEGNSDKAVESLTRLTTILDKLTNITSASLGGLSQTSQKIKSIANNANKSEQSTKKSFNNMGKSVLGFVTKMTGIKLGLMDSTNYMSSFISTYSGFNKVLGTSKKNLDDAEKFVRKLTDAWYLDEQQVRSAMTRYYSMTSTMGFTEEASLRMSQNLTQLSYDLQALGITGGTISEVQNQLASALRGEAEGLAKFGVSLNQATLQSVLYENGINRTVSSLNAAQKAEVIYYQIMKQTYSKHGYYAEQLKQKVIQPAMAMQIFKNQVMSLARAIGSILIPIITKILPYLTALTQMLTELANKIAGFFGFKIGDWGADLDNIGTGIGNIGDNADKAGKKIKGMLGDFDELHTISFDSGAGSSAGAGGSLGLDASQFEYSNKLLEVTNEQLEKAKNIINTIKDYIIAIGIGFASFKIAKNVLDFLEKMNILTNSENFFRIALGIGLSIAGIYLIYQGMTKILEGEITPENILKTLIGNLALAGGIVSITGGNISLAIGITLALTSFMVSYAGAEKILSGDFGWADIFSVVGGSLGVGLASLIATGSLTLGGLGVILSVVASFALAALPSFDEIKEAFSVVIAEIQKWWNSAETKEKFFAIGSFLVTAIFVGITATLIGVPAIVGTMLIAFVLAIMAAFGIHSPAKKMIPYGEYIILGIFEGIMALFGKVVDIFVDLKDKIIEKLVILKDKIKEKVQEIKTNVTNKFTEIKTNITNKVQEIKTNALNKFEEIKNGIKDKINSAKDLVKKAIDAIKGFFKFEWSLPQIKIPHFGIEWDTQGAVAKAFQKIGLQGLPKLKVDWYAEGGFPTKGDLFVANEAGAEWVGSMNGRTAVANQDQISTGIRQAAYEGMRQALAESDFGGVNVYNYLDSKDIASKMTKVKKSNEYMYG